MIKILRLGKPLTLQKYRREIKSNPDLTSKEIAAAYGCSIYKVSAFKGHLKRIENR